MAEIVSFYSRNTDGELQLVPVVSPVVTLPLNRYSATTGGGGPSPYDSEGSLTGIAEVDHTELGELDDQAIDAYALLLAANLGEKWNRDGWAFMGLESIEINSSSGVLDGDFKSPPTVELKGGEALMENGSPYPDFVPASVEALTNHLGQVTGFNITEPGSFYDSDRAPKLYLNGQHFPDVQVRISYLLVSYVILSNYSKGALGLGYVGGPGSHVMLASGTLSRSTTAHEVGHNFGLQHAQRYNTKSEIVLSDDADQTEYGNKYSVMGTADDLVTSGDITVPGKVMMNLLFEGTTGYVKGKSIGVDVAELDQSNLFGVNEFREQDADRNNTFRIYRSNQGTPPASLRTESFQVRLPPMEYNLLEELNVSTLAVKFEGTGEEANATFDFVDPLWTLNISQAGRGYASEPVVQLVHPVDGDVFLSLAPEWIEEAAGTDYNQTAKLLDNEKRWVRGICVKPNAPQVKPFSFFSGYDLMDYYLSYRTDISEYGIALNIATDPALSKGVLEPFLLDSTPQTPQDYSDAALLIGSTYSDYDSDLHFTPVKVGGVDPMTYVEVVIHSGTIEDDLAKVPDFELVSSETNPALGEQVRFSIVSGNATKKLCLFMVSE
jgi:hypothetical protein